MKFKNYMKKLPWVLLVVAVPGLMIWRFQVASESIRIYQEPDFDYYFSLFWEILKEGAALMPIWLLCLLGLARSFLGENWFPFAVKIPIRATKLILVVTAPLLIGVAVAGALYSEYANDSYAIQYMLENRFEAWESTLTWILFYARTDEEIQPDNTYMMSGNRISVKTLDLNCDFPAIAAQLNAIADKLIA